MQNNRKPFVVGLFVLLLIGLAIGWMIVSGRDSNAPVGPTYQSSDDRRTSRAPDSRRTSQPDEGAFADENGTQRQGVGGDVGGGATAVAQRPPARPTTVSVSGVAVDFDDFPADGVTLTLLAEDGATTSGPTAVTNADGEFLFETSLNIGWKYVVVCLEDRRALTATQSFTIREDTPVEGLKIQVYWAGRVHGVVLDGATNEPIEGVNIRMDARRDERLQRLGTLLGRFKPTVSNERGEFAVDHLAPGSFLAYAEKSGWAASEINPTTRDRQEVTVDEYSNVELLPFVLIRAGAIEGFVLRQADNRPVVGAVVELGTIFGGTQNSTVSDETGFYRFDTVPPPLGGAEGGGGGGGGGGGITVRATATGYAIATRNLNVRSGQTRRNVNLMMRSGCTVEGVVLNHEREPIAGASVYFNENEFQQGGEMVAGVATPPRTVRTTTDENGRFSLSGLPPGGASITARAERYSHATVQAATSPEETAEVTITLHPAGRIEGYVTNELGQPVVGVPVAAYDASGPGALSFVMRSFFGETLPDRGESTLIQANVMTDEEGFYVLDGLPAGKYVLVANTRRYQKYASPELEVRVGAVTEHDFVLLTGGRIFGRVYDAGGGTVAGAAVTASGGFGGDNIRVRTAYTDRSGSYEITGLQPGTYTVVRNDGNFASLLLPRPSSQVNVRAGESVEFDLYEQRPGTARLYGRVFLDGEPYANEQIALLGGSRRGFAADTTRTDANGYYEFRSVALGAYQIAQSGGMMPSLVRQRVHVNREGDMQLDVEFTTVTITGRVRLENGELPEGRVRVLASPINPEGRANPDEEVNELEMMVFREVRTDAETGEFQITGLSPGHYRVTARSPENGMVTLPYVNAMSNVTGLNITLPTVGATLLGIVTGLDEAENNTPFGLIAALTIEDEQGRPLALGGFDNGVNLSTSKDFTVENLAEGRFTVTLSISGYTPVTYSNVQLRNGEILSLTFAFAPSGNLKLTLQNNDIDIQTALGLEYEIRNSKGELFKKRFTFLDFFANDGAASQNPDENSFVITDLPPEDYTITLSLPGYRDVARSFTIIAGQTAEISVQFTPE